MILKYSFAAANGHEVIALLHTTFGGIGPHAMDLLVRMDRHVKGRLNEDAPWTARTFLPMHAQRISTACQREAARQILQARDGSF